MNVLRRLVDHPRIALVLWCLVIPVVFIKHNFLTDFSNNYLIFKYTYVHAVDQENLYGYHPGDYEDKNHYGPVFSLLFAPFAVLPNWLGHLLYVGSIIVLLAWAIRSLPLEQWQKNAIMLLCLNELFTAGFNVQFNIAIAAFLLLSFAWIWYEKEVVAALPIAAGTFVKLYGVVGLALFFQVKHKGRFILGGLLWAVLLFVLPMLLSSPEYVVNMYAEWYKYLVIKNSENVSLISHQDISILGFTRRLFADPTLPNTPFLITGVLIFALPYLRVSKYQEPAFQFLQLASVMMFPVLFSSASESSTYIIVFSGIAIWFVIQPDLKSWPVVALMIFAFVLGSLNTSDIYPPAWRTWLREHSVKALPCTIIWLRIIYEMLTSDFRNYRVPQRYSSTNTLPSGT